MPPVFITNKHCASAGKVITLSTIQGRKTLYLFHRYNSSSYWTDGIPLVGQGLSNLCINSFLFHLCGNIRHGLALDLHPS